MGSETVSRKTLARNCDALEELREISRRNEAFSMSDLLNRALPELFNPRSLKDKQKPQSNNIWVQNTLEGIQNLNSISWFFKICLHVPNTSPLYPPIDYSFGTRLIVPSLGESFWSNDSQKHETTPTPPPVGNSLIIEGHELDDEKNSMLWEKDSAGKPNAKQSFRSHQYF